MPEYLPAPSISVHQARERVAHVWGGGRILSVWRRLDYGFDVQLRPAGVASDLRARNHSYHQLDARGNVVCHDDCRALARDRSVS